MIFPNVPKTQFLQDTKIHNSSTDSQDKDGQQRAVQYVRNYNVKHFYSNIKTITG